MNNFYHINKTLGYIWTEEEEGRISNQKQSFINSLNFLHYYKSDLNKITQNNYGHSQVYKDILNYYFIILDWSLIFCCASCALLTLVASTYVCSGWG